MSYQIEIKNEIEMIAFGEKLGALLSEGDLILLEGDLGAGKTTLSKGIAKGLDVKQIVNSPTFTILKIYQGRLPLYHMDAYRLESQSAIELGFDELFEGDGVCVIEWPKMIEDDLPTQFLKIRLSIYRDGRMLELLPVGQYYEQLCEELI